jgi:hypothetical protein
MKNNNSLQPFCIKRMIDIIKVYGEESHLIKVSDENVEKALIKIANVKIKPDITVKTALCNLEKFRPEVRSAFELQLFNVWYNAFKTLDVDKAENIEEPGEIEESQSEVEEIIEEPVVIEESESVVEEVVEEEIIEEPVALEESEPEVEEIIEEPVEIEESQSEVEEIIEEPVVIEESESVVEEVVEEEIIEEPVALEESEPEVEEIIEEPVEIEESESEVEEVVEEEIVEKPDSVEPEMKSVEHDEQQVEEKTPVVTEQSTDQLDESEAFPKKRKRDWFDFLLDCSAAMMQFFIRILFRKRP